MSNNQLYTHLTQHGKRPSLQITFCLAVGLALLSLIPGAYDLWNIVQGIEPVAYSNILAALAWPLAVISPPIVALTAAGLVSRDTPEPESPIAQVTESQIVWGYVLAALYRLRVWLAVVVGILPLLVIGMLNLALAGLVSQAFAEPCIDPLTQSPAFNCYTPTTLDVIVPLAEMGMVGLGMLAMNLLASVIGTTLALWWERSSKTAAFLSMIVTLLGALFGVIVMLTVLGPTIGGTGFSQFSNPLRDLALPCGGCLVPPIMLALGMMVLARRVSRKDREGGSE